jgi:hypothetical protein
LTFLPLLPLFSVPFLRFFIARATFFAAPLEYFLAMSGAPCGEYHSTNTRHAAWFRFAAFHPSGSGRKGRSMAMLRLVSAPSATFVAGR